MGQTSKFLVFIIKIVVYFVFFFVFERSNEDLDIGGATELLEELAAMAARGGGDGEVGSALRERLVIRNCSAWTDWSRGRPGNSRLTPKKIQPDDPIPTAPTWNLEIGGRAKVWADLTNDGRSWSTVWPIVRLRLSRSRIWVDPF
ncbi:hypothetical protein F3Y22_tig00111238pilonHSYRG00230 [Hibiscus syriacus]|uniref:Uncharacterized protein n=1 Tax=Hibiscus syriacus TaxID=106335 RepID=A0A6A2YU18_HIBSY|nr:hypothetical protein F3Y22_tig00111238pilonHSYRG00230 [Hibiscus syriacus]